MLLAEFNVYLRLRGIFNEASRRKSAMDVDACSNLARNTWCIRTSFLNSAPTLSERKVSFSA
jgi:hypothetical protein